MERRRIFIIFIFVIHFFTFYSILRAQEAWILSDSIADEKIVSDHFDGFFDRIQPIEISIQLKDSTLSNKTRSEVLPTFKESLKEETIEPSLRERERIRTAFHEALARASKLFIKYPMPDTIYLGLLKGDLYGDGVFYTRENGIFLPQNMTAPLYAHNLTEIFLHEFFHIQSRMHPELQASLYKQIGFIELNNPPIMDSTLLARTLLNPDGTDWNFAIPLERNDEKVLAFPLIIANENSYKPGKPNFFHYLKFQLYALDKTEENYKVVREANFEGLDRSWMPIFLNQITDNTDYIIHPDEIIADNFVILANLLSGKNKQALSEKGEKLIHKIAEIYEVEIP